MAWNRDLECDVTGFSYSFDGREGLLFMAAESNCRMDGCVELFQKIDPNVQLITTFAANEADTVYYMKNGKWVSGDPPQPTTFPQHTPRSGKVVH